MFRRTWWVVAAYAALTLIMTWPLWLRAASHHLGGGIDPWLFLWTIGWDVHALTHAPWAIFDAPIFYPHQNTLAYSEHLIGAAIMAAPVIWLTDNPLLATNIVALSSVFLCAIGGYVLGRKLGLSRPAAFLCGLVFAFTPPRFGRIYQLHLTTIHWMPFALAFLHGYFENGRARDLRLAALFFSLQALTSGHGTVLLVMGAALMIAFRFLSGEKVALRRRVRDIGLPGVLLLVPAALIVIPYWRARSEVGLVRQHDDVGVTASSWLATSSHADRFLVSLLPDWEWLQMPPDVILFPGLLTLALAAVAFIAPRAKVIWLHLAMLLLTLWMTIGPPFGVWQWIYWVPGLSFIRVPSRFMQLGMLGLSVLAAFGFERLTARLGPARRSIAAFAAAVLLAGEFASMPTDVRPLRHGPYPIDRWLDTLPKPFSLVEIPVPQSSLKPLVARRHAEYMLHSMAHFQPIVQGFSGIEPPGFEELERTLMLFPDEKSIDTLAGMNVTYAVVHLDYFPPELVDYALTGLDRFEREGRLRLVHVEGAGRVYAIQKR